MAARKVQHLQSLGTTKLFSSFWVLSQDVNVSARKVADAEVDSVAVLDCQPGSVVQYLFPPQPSETQRHFHCIVYLVNFR